MLTWSTILNIYAVSLYLHIYQFFCLSDSFSISLTKSLYHSYAPPPFSLSLSLFTYLSPSPSLSHHLFPSLSLTHSLSFCLSISLTHSLFLSLFLSLVFFSSSSAMTLFLIPCTGGVTKWESVESGPDVIAPYGTRVGALADPTLSGTGTNISASPKEPDCVDLTGDQAQLSSTDISYLEDVEWRYKISPGTLVDAKDSQNVWYQVRSSEVLHFFQILLPTE